MKITDYIAAPDGITAAAHRVTPSAQGINTGDGSDRWKSRAWQAYNEVGELRKVTQWLANSLSRVNLYAADVNDSGTPSTTPTEDDTATRVVADIAGGPAGQAKLLGRIATGLTVVGETWIAVIRRQHDDGTETEEWHALSAREISRTGNNVILRLEDGDDHPFDPAVDILTRVHRPHPENSRESDSPVRSALQPLSEIVRTSAAIEGAAKSRLAGNGILALPQEIAIPNTEPPKGEADAPGLPAEQPADRSVSASDIMRELQQVMTTAIADPNSAASRVPIVLKAPGETLDKIRHITLHSEVTAENLETREKAIIRLARSLDIPPEILTGIGGTNHWNAWSIDEDAVRSHIAPMMTIICDALTEAVLRPLLDIQGVDSRRYVIWFDTTPLTQKPDRSEDAIDAYDRGAISVDTLRRELGFDDADAPDTGGEQTAEEKKAADRQLALDIVKGAPSSLPLLAHILELPPPPGGWNQGAAQPAEADRYAAEHSLRQASQRRERRERRHAQRQEG